MNDAELVKSLVGLAGVPITLGLVKALKPFFSDHRLYPILSLVVGLGFNFLLAWALGFLSTNLGIAVAFIYGIMAGLGASGLYSGVSEAKRVALENKNMKGENENVVSQ